MISIIIPIIRPDKAERCIEAAYINAGIPEDDYEIVTGEDIDRIGCPKMVARLVAETRYEMVMFLGDDTIPQPDFLKNALAAMQALPEGWGLVGLNDGHHDGNQLATHWLAHKKLLLPLGGEFFHTGYKHCFCDNELIDRCRAMGRYVWAENAGIKHDNPILDGQEMDEDYQRVYDDENYMHDWRLYHRRRLDRTHGIRLAIGLPLLSQLVYSSFFTSFLAMNKPNYVLLMPGMPRQTDLPQSVSCADMGRVRNSLVWQAFIHGCTHLVMMDTDQNYPRDTLVKLLNHERPVVGAMVHRRYPPFDPILYRGELGKYTHVPLSECYSGKLVSVEASGAGCVLYDLRVFLDTDTPWFVDKTRDDSDGPGEDIYFCSQLRKAGIDIHVDTSIEVGHLGLMEINRGAHQVWQKINQSKGE
jgi:hypothetical protein